MAFGMMEFELMDFGVMRQKSYTNSRSKHYSVINIPEEGQVQWSKRWIYKNVAF